MPEIKQKRQTDPRIARIRIAKNLSTRLQAAHAARELAMSRIELIHTEINGLLSQADSEEETAFLQSLISVA